jgi:DNA gyrase/topoisomerase IV subunit A
MRVVIELKRGEVPEVVLNNLYKQTQLQDTFGMNMVALVDGQPRLLNLKQMLECFLAHRREVVTRARCSSCARRASAAISSKAWRWRCPTSTRSSR